MSERVQAIVFRYLAFSSFVPSSQKIYLIGFEILAYGCGNIAKSLICEDLSVSRTQIIQSIAFVHMQVIVLVLK